MEEAYESKILWSQLDANMHLRHSAYSDIATQARMEMLEKAGLGFGYFHKMKIGPVIFREELNYLREVRPNDTVKVTTEITKSSSNGSFYSIRQELFRGDGIKAAIINLDGSWFDTVKRELIEIPEELSGLFNSLPKSENYQEK